MACDCCCTKILRICKVPVCGTAEVDFGIKAQALGTYTMKFMFLGVEFTKEVDFEIDQQIKFPVGDLNESFTFTARIYDPSGNQILIQKAGVNYDCFEFETIPSYVL